MKKLISCILLGATILFCCPSIAHADDGTNFGASIRIGTGGYGEVSGYNNSKFYHLTPGRAGLEVQNASGASFDVYLYKGNTSYWNYIDKCVDITSPTWRRFYDIPDDGNNYWLRIGANGASGTTAYISGVLHDHGDPY